MKIKLCFVEANCSGCGAIGLFVEEKNLLCLACLGKRTRGGKWIGRKLPANVPDYGVADSLAMDTGEGERPRSWLVRWILDIL